MIAWWTAAAAGPVLSEVSAEDLFERCVSSADAEAGELLPEPSVIEAAERIAVVVGVPCHRSAQIPSLQYSTRDATLVGRKLRDAGFLVVPLVSSVDRETLIDVLDRVASAATPTSTLVFYFSGHGTLREEGGELHRYLVMSDTDLGMVHSTGLSVLSLEDRIDQIKAGARFIIQDTCFAERPVESSSRDKGLLPPEADLELQPGDLRLYGSRYFEQAVESVELRGSIYTVHLLGALGEGEADLDKDGCVGLLEAHLWARDHVVDARAGYQVPQHRVGPLGDMRNENLPLACSGGPPTRAVFDLHTEEGWAFSVSDRAGRSVQGPSLVPGRYRFEASVLTEGSSGELTRETHFDAYRTVRAGQWLDLSDEIAARRPLRWASLRAQGSLTDQLPAGAVGLEGGLALADRGRGRLVFGLSAGYRPGPGGTLTRGDAVTEAYQMTAFRAAEIGASIQPARTFLLPGDSGGALIIGPMLSLGAVVRDAYAPDRHNQGGAKDLSPPLLGSFGDVGFRILYERRPLILSIDAGAKGLLISRTGTLPVVWSPTLSFGVGREL